MSMKDNIIESEAALPDIYRVKGHYLDSYYNCIEDITKYRLTNNGNALNHLKGSIISLYLQLKEELSSIEKQKLKAVENLIIDTKKTIDFNSLVAAFYILAHRLKLLKIIDIKLKDGISFDFR